MLALEKGELILARWDLSIAVLESAADSGSIDGQRTVSVLTFGK
jgi:hypothetical protein